jgi:predicted negative regulator of RcsB-dependent stress response
MATHLDLEEQEQLDQLKAFWKQYGNLITWALIAVLAAFAAWNGWNLWQRDQSGKASAMYDELEKAAQAGDVAKAAGVFADMKERFPRTTFTQQGALLAARTQFEKGLLDAASTTLAWVADNAAEDEYRSAARLRLAGLLLDEKKYDEALKVLDAASSKEFAALVADRRGDVLIAQGKMDDAKAAYTKAWKAMDAGIDYRRLIEAKLTALGGAPEADKAQAGGPAQ